MLPFFFFLRAQFWGALHRGFVLHRNSTARVQLNFPAYSRQESLKAKSKARSQTGRFVPQQADPGGLVGGGGASSHQPADVSGTDRSFHSNLYSIQLPSLPATGLGIVCPQEELVWQKLVGLVSAAAAAVLSCWTLTKKSISVQTHCNRSKTLGGTWALNNEPSNISLPVEKHTRHGGQKKKKKSCTMWEWNN